jgi:hypothetical protein
MPGHGAVSRSGVLASGGPRGCVRRSNTSMTIMASAAARARRAEVVWFGRWIVHGVRRGREQAAGEREAGLAGAAGEQAVVPDAMEATRQDMQQEPVNTSKRRAGSDRWI